VIGSSFIGMEVAAFFAGKKRTRSVTGMEAVPFERVLGGDVSRAMMGVHEAKRVLPDAGDRGTVSRDKRPRFWSDREARRWSARDPSVSRGFGGRHRAIH
jgi:hypothetical protein